MFHNALTTGNFYKVKTFPLELWGGGHVMSKSIVIEPFNYDEQNGYLKILGGRSWEKRGGGRAPSQPLYYPLSLFIT